MRLARIKLAGFKSFVDPTTVSFPSNLTGVVGPNGCGKSNVLEAIRWVMGESSPKSMRGSGMDDVIFAGTAMRPARDFSEVSLLVERVERLQGEIRGLLGLGFKPNQFSLQAAQLQSALEQIPYAQLEVTRAQRELDQFRDDARKRDIMPGWLR